MRKLIINDIPEGYDYADVNLDGEAFAYKGEPTITVDKWVGEESCYIGHDFYNTKWKDSLLYRFPNRKLTVEDIPEGYSYAVICNDGSAYCSKRKPIISSNLGWNLPFYEYRKIDGYFDSSDWQNSLIEK